MSSASIVISYINILNKELSFCVIEVNIRICYNNIQFNIATYICWNYCGDCSIDKFEDRINGKR